MTGLEKTETPPGPGQPRTGRKYRVLHVIDSLDLGGAQVVLENLIRHGNHDQFEFEAATMHGRGVYWDRLAALGVPLHSLSFHHKVPLYVPRLAWLCLTRRYDVVHTHLLAANVIAKPVATFSGVRVRINHDHCNDKLTDPRWWALDADRITNRFSTHVIAVSESTRAFVVEKEGVPAARATTVHNGIDLEKFRPPPGTPCRGPRQMEPARRCLRRRRYRAPHLPEKFPALPRDRRANHSHTSERRLRARRHW